MAHQFQVGEDLLALECKRLSYGASMQGAVGKL
jgi:hypothetical protein